MAFSLGAQGVVTNVKGKVELQNPGELWAPAEIDAEVSLNSQISTGFNSQATIELNKNIVTVRTLTRMSLGAYTQKEGLTTTTLRLTAGRVRVNVNYTEDRKKDFKVQSAVATASVRGTVFEFDGLRLEVEDGIVQMVNLRGQEIIITKGGATVIKKDAQMTTPKEQDEAQSKVVMVAPPEVREEAPEPPSKKDSTLSTKGSLAVRIR